MKISASNIAWDFLYDEKVYSMMAEFGFSGIEIAPTRIFPVDPYGRPGEARAWKEQIWKNYGLSVSSMQSIWYGRSERIFGSKMEQNALIEYTKKAIEFAAAIECENLVFGCPRNRNIPENVDVDAAIPFFKELGDYAYQHHTVLSMEANPPIYNTNFLNTTQEAIRFIEDVGSGGFLLNLDIGTMVENGEDLSVLSGREDLIHHIHISEPGLANIQARELHKELALLLKDMNYQNFVSLEVACQDDIEELSKMMEYIKGVFG